MAAPSNSAAAKVLCECRFKAKVYTSNTPTNPKREFYKCPVNTSKGFRGCRFWEWRDDYDAKAREQQMLNMVQSLQIKVNRLQEDNEKLRTSLNDAAAADLSSSTAGTNGVTIMDVLCEVRSTKERVEQLERVLGVNE